MRSVRERWNQLSKWYARFVEKQGFLIILAVCVGVIAATAVWTRQTDTPRVAPTPPVDEAASAARLSQQSLKDAATQTPAPTQAPAVFSAPLDTVTVLRGFEGTRLAPSGVTGVWQLHDACDLQAEAGALVKAMASGVVTECADQGVMGAYVAVDHGDGVVALYAGMKALSAVRAGDPVQAGQTLGFAGSGMVDETDLPAHLHLRVERNGKAVDPVLLWR